MKIERKKEKKTRRKKKKGVSLSTIILVAILLAGLGVMLYPTVSDYWNSFHQTRAIHNYDQVVAELDETDYEKLFAEAEEYNQRLWESGALLSQNDQLSEEYYRVLDVAGNGIIGYVTIEKIGVELPVYHGTSDSILNMAVGHIEGSSLPIGGESRHSVLSAHRGLPSAKLFTDLDKMEVGDTFTITVLNRLLTYEVDQILIIEPEQLDALNVAAGQDYCTLMTCTPYGINTHRLLVRGHRIENARASIVVHKEATRIPPYIVAPAVAIPIVFVLLIVLLVVYRKKPARITTTDVQELAAKLEAGKEEAKKPEAEKKEAAEEDGGRKEDGGGEP